MKFGIENGRLPRLPTGENQCESMIISFDALPVCDGQIDRWIDWLIMQ